MTTLPLCADAPALAAAIAGFCHQATQEGDSWQACCPAHEDLNPSLSISPADDKVLLHCFAECTTEAVVTALGLTMKDLFIRGHPQSNGHKRIVKVYDYYDASGTLVHQTVRYEPKDFKQRRPDPAKPGEFIWNLKGVTPVLYHLPLVLQAIQEGKRIWLCEGEKDCENLQWHLPPGEIASTNAMGAKYWRKAYTETLRSAHVVILPDNDQAGRERIDKVAQSLHGSVASLKVVDLPGLPAKGDVSDWLSHGHAGAELQALVEAAPLWTPPQDSQRRHNGQTPDAGRPTTPPPQSAHTSSTLDNDDYPYGDAYNAFALVRRYGQDLRYCTAWKSWLTWTGTHWQRDTSGLVLRWQRQTVQAFGALLAGMDDKQTAALLAHIKSSLSTGRLKAAIDQAPSWEGMSLEPEAFDTDPWLLNCTNGTLDLHTGTLRPHRQADMLTKCLSIAYDPEAQCPTWERFLWRIMGGSQGEDSPDMSAGELENRQKADERARSLIGFLQQAVGYTLTGSNREQCLFILHGPTKTGKSTFLGTLRMLFGPYGQQADMESFMHKERQEVRNDLADLAGSRFVCAMEGQEGRRLAEALIKQMTGGLDHIKARFLFQEHFEYQPQFKVFLGTNHKPKISDDDAIWERIRPVPFTVQIPKPERDKTLDNRLQAELPGILAWAVRGCLEWQRLGELKEPEAVQADTAGYRSEMDNVGRFIQECCLVSPQVRVKAGDLYDAYKAWCAATGEQKEQIISLTAMGKRLDDKGFAKHSSNYTWRLGLALKDQKEP